MCEDRRRPGCSWQAVSHPHYLPHTWVWISCAFCKALFWCLTSPSPSPLTLTAKPFCIQGPEISQTVSTALWFPWPSSCLLYFIGHNRCPDCANHKIKTGPILQISSHAHWWRVVYGLSGWTLCKLQGWVYRLNVQQEYSAPAEQFPCRGN